MTSPQSLHSLRLPGYRSSYCLRYHPYPMTKRPRLLRAQDDALRADEETWEITPVATLGPVRSAEDDSDDDVSCLDLDASASVGLDIKRRQEAFTLPLPSKVATILAYVVIAIERTSRMTRLITGWVRYAMDALSQ
ncbi:uncharacterized protein LAESUDRAFT_718906 [Laetiporus sulphureus 93-53]|uniref:Uncharacterized protein n=1 Tax=Laetiporus sulphureus 93-53 TaxID=1314785 RepID=A0A165I5R6_9APHY|nr:uncharacterized protein LAESUDRAFT_718906 [Laetiporus sulphureus 93-53]KZT12627.1 hypothetical protein LAESUDRAFT_718906 [Laetiporus sulphureus 93-53]